MTSVEEPTDRVCLHCDGILTWYPPVGGYFHTRSGQLYVTGHRPEPKPSLDDR